MITRPREVGWALSLQLIALALSPFATALDWKHLNSVEPIQKLIFVEIFIISILGYVLWRISKGKNWARIVLLLSFLLGLPSFLIYLRADFARSLALGVVVVLEAVLEVAGLWLLFVAPAKDWFKSASSMRRPSSPG
jgi:hypothetical protein